MASGIHIMVGGVRTDLDSVFAPIESSTPTSTTTGFKTSGGSDIRLRYYAATGGDTRASNTGLKYWNGGSYVDLKNLFRDFNFSGAPTITTQPSPATVDETESTTLTVVAAGASPLSYQWKKNGSNISNGGHYSGATTASLTISSADENDDANYKCTVSNAHGTIDSSEVHVTVILIPVINNGAVGGGEFNVEGGPYSFNEGDGPVLKVTTSRGQNLSYQWKLNGSNVGSNSSTHAITVGPSTDGTYTCVVSNTAGSDTSSNCVISIIAPVIDDANSTVKTGGITYDFNDGESVADFHVSTSAGTNLSYVWTKDGVNLGINSAQGPVYNPATTADSGYYEVTVSNNGGSAIASAQMNVT